jgi:hypothetical protein
MSVLDLEFLKYKERKQFSKRIYSINYEIGSTNREKHIYLSGSISSLSFTSLILILFKMRII